MAALQQVIKSAFRGLTVDQLWLSRTAGLQNSKMLRFRQVGEKFVIRGAHEITDYNIKCRETLLRCQGRFAAAFGVDKVPQSGILKTYFW